MSGVGDTAGRITKCDMHTFIHCTCVHVYIEYAHRYITDSVACNYNRHIIDDILDDSNASITAGQSHHSQMNRGVLFGHTHHLVGMGTGLDCSDAAEGVCDAEAHPREASYVWGLLLVGEVAGTPQLYQPLVR